MTIETMNNLREKLASYLPRNTRRYREYDMKYNSQQPSDVIPAELQARYKTVFGWCAKAVDSLADRLVVQGFRNDDFNITRIFEVNSPHVLFDSAMQNALISSCSFVYISEGANGGQPRLQVIDSRNATGNLDPITGLLKEGYAVLKRNEYGEPLIEAFFESDRTTILEKDKTPGIYNHNYDYALLVPVIYKPDADRPFGRSRITRSAMNYQQFAKRTLERADIIAEFYSFPQKYITGLSNKAEKVDTWKATVSSFLAFGKDEQGDSPKLGQFTTPSMSPFTEQLRMAASLFAGETGLTLDDLGFVSDNPSSAEAIKASHENMRLMARKAQSDFENAFVNVAYLAACVRDKKPYTHDAFTRLKVKWAPIFEPDVSMISQFGDAIYKINEVLPGYITEEFVDELLGR